MSDAIGKLVSGTVLDNKGLCATFLCGPQGGMRRSKRTSSLVIVSNHLRSIYDDRWIGDVLHYTGMGTVGDQRLDATQNRTLAKSQINGVAVHLFEVFMDKYYTYVGQVSLADKPYQETQPDENQDLRKVWMFPLKLSSGEQVQVPEQVVRAIRKTKERQARKLTDEDLLKRAKCASKRPGTRRSSVSAHDRSEWVSAYAKRSAAGTCQLCGEVAPFADKSGDPFLESHHVQWLSKGGEDSIENTVALCPNCHRRMHVLDLSKDKIALLQKIARRGERE